MGEYKVSVIIPVYNVEEYLSECIDSVVKQTLQDIEIILIDDGSTDGSGEICDKYAEKNNNILVVHQENRGLSCVRNRGIEIASGEYVQFLDSDDYITENACEVLYNAAKKYGTDVIRGDLVGYQRKTEVDNKPLKVTEYLKCALDYKFYDIITVLDLVKRETLLRRKIKFIEGCSYEDQQYMMNFLSDENSTIVKISHPFYFYRMRPGSITKSVHEKKVLEFLKILAEMRKIAEKFNFETEVRKNLDNVISLGVWHFSRVWIITPKLRYKTYRDLKQIFKDYRFDYCKLNSRMKIELQFFLKVPYIALNLYKLKEFLKKVLKGLQKTKNAI